MLAVATQYDSYRYQSNAEAMPLGVSVSLLIAIVAVSVFLIVCNWRIFNKAGEQGWYSVVPILNTYTLLKIVGRPWWWMLLMLVPCVSFVVAIVVMLDLARVFGKGPGFGVGLAFLSPIFLPILAFGSAQHFSRVRDEPRFGPAALAATGGYGGYGGYGGGVVPTGPVTPAAPGGWAPHGAGQPAGQMPQLPTQQIPTAPSPLPPSAPQPPPVAPVAAGPAEGWYPDPSGEHHYRYWDGTSWTDHVS